MIASDVNTRTMRQTAMPLAWVDFIIAEPIVSSISSFYAVFESTYVGVSIALQLIPAAAVVASMVDALENWAVVEDGYR